MAYKFDGKERVSEEKQNVWSHLWRYFLSGVLITAPVALTFYIIWAVVNTIDQNVKAFLPVRFWLDRYLPFDIPGLGLIIAFGGFTLIGAVAAGYLGRLLVKTGENILNRMPVIRGLYSAVKQILEAVFKRDKSSFREVVLVQYPRKGIWSLGFVTGVTRGEVQVDTIDEVVNVFIPTTPNPTSGFLLFIPRKELINLKMTVEEGIKMVVSAGIITPVYKKEEAYPV